MKNKVLAALAASAIATVLVQAQPTSIDLSQYVRVGRYYLPEPSNTTPPNSFNLLAQEASAVTYNRDTDTLFIVGDGGRAIVQVSKTGAYINSMTLAAGSSPQGTYFYDTEGLTYIGGGQFVMVEERNPSGQSLHLRCRHHAGQRPSSEAGHDHRQQRPGRALLRSQDRRLYLRQGKRPAGSFPIHPRFRQRHASNGSPSTVNSTNLFDPAVLSLADIADVFSLSNVTSLLGNPHYDNLLILSQETGKILNVDRSGNILNSSRSRIFPVIRARASLRRRSKGSRWT